MYVYLSAKKKTVNEREKLTWGDREVRERGLLERLE